MFYIRILKKLENKQKKQNFTEFLFLSKTQKLNLSLFKLLNINVYGISIKRFIYIFGTLLGCGVSLKILNLKEEFILYLQKLLRQSLLNNELKEYIKQKKEFKWFLQLYTALRQKQNLPSRGQRTKTNARTNKQKQKGNIIGIKSKMHINKKKKKVFKGVKKKQKNYISRRFYKKKKR